MIFGMPWKMLEELRKNTASGVFQGIPDQATLYHSIVTTKCSASWLQNREKAGEFRRCLPFLASKWLKEKPKCHELNQVKWHSNPSGKGESVAQILTKIIPSLTRKEQIN